MLKRVLKHIQTQVSVKQAAQKEYELHQKLLRHEAKIGGKLFGAIPRNHRRDFFCLDRHTWIWHEESVNTQGERVVTTTRYNIQPNKVLKSQNNSHYQPVSFKELENLYHATQEYKKRVHDEIYSLI